MSIGSLNYFGTWFENQKTNPLAWLKRYMWEDEEVEDTDKPSITQRLSTFEIHEKAKEHFADIGEYLNLSRKNIARKTRLTRIAAAAICVLLLLVSFAWFQSEKLNKLISKTKHANEIATKAYLKLESDPTLAFRLAEQAYNIEPTDLSRQVIMAGYGVMPFYRKLVGHTAVLRSVKYSPDGNYILTGSDDNSAKLWSSDGKLLHSLEGHTARISGPGNDVINFSHDSKYIVTSSPDSTARLWDLEGRCLAVMKHEKAVSSAVFSPPPNPLLKTGGGEPARMNPSEKNYLILTASSDKTARIWQFNSPLSEGGSPARAGQGDVAGRKINPPLLQPTVIFKGHTKGLRLAKFSPDGKYILTVAGDTTARIWNLKGKQLHVLKGHKGAITDLRISKDGNYIITGSWDNTARIWNSSGKLLHILKGHTDFVYSIDISPDSRYVVTTANDNTVRIWDINGKELHISRGHTSFVWNVNFSPDGKHIATASDDGTARLWDLNGTELMVMSGHAGQILSANFSPDGKYVVTASADQTARIWKTRPEENPIFKGHLGEIIDIDFSPDEKYIVTASGRDYTARIWDVSGNELTVLRGHTYLAVVTANFSHDGKNIITSGWGDQTARIWDIQGNQLLALKIDKGNMADAIFSLNDKMILTYSDNNAARLWNKNGDSLQVFKNVTDVEFSEDGSYIATLSTDSSICFWIRDPQGFGNLAGLPEKQSDSIAEPYKQVQKLRTPGTAFTSVEFSPDGKWLLTTSEDSTARLWKLEDVKNLPEDSIKPIYEYKHPVIVSQPLFSPDSKLFLIVGNDNIVRIFDLECNVIAEMKGHTDAITDANFSKDSKYIVTGSNDFTVRVWDLNGNELQMLTGHKAAITKAKFSADGKYILTASNDHTAMLMPWRVEDVLHKINVEKVRGEIWELSEEDKKLYGIID